MIVQYEFPIIHSPSGFPLFRITKFTNTETLLIIFLNLPVSVATKRWITRVNTNDAILIVYVD